MYTCVCMYIYIYIYIYIYTHIHASILADEGDVLHDRLVLLHPVREEHLGEVRPEVMYICIYIYIHMT